MTLRGAMPNSIQAKLEEAVGAAKNEYSKLIVLVTEDETKRGMLISDFAKSRGVDVINLNASLSGRLLERSAKERVSVILDELREIVDTPDTVAVIDHCEVLFDKTLKNDPLKLLENVSRNKTILVAWPGSYRERKLIYATAEHPEYRCYENPDVVIVSGNNL